MTSAHIDDTEGFAGSLANELGVGEVRSGSWFTKLVQRYLRRNATRAHTRAAAGEDKAEVARRLIRRASFKTAATGVASGLTSTGSALLTLNTQGLGAVVGVPATAAGLLGDVIYRAVVHVDLTCALAALYDVQLDPADPADLLRLYELIFGDDEDEGALSGARGVLDRVLALGGDDMGMKIGRKLLGQALRRNVVPVLGVATSAVGNARTTRKLGETVLRYVRYQRALQDELGPLLDDGLADLAVEGTWFVLTADGQLRPEEGAILAWLLRRRPAIDRAAVLRRFTEDEADWMGRLGQVPEPHRERIYRSLEVAAAVDRSASLPERRMLRNAARALGQSFDGARLEALTRTLDQGT